MRRFGTIAIAVLLAAAPATARSADLLAVPVASGESVPVAGPEFDWNGFYAGVYGVTQASSVGGLQYGLGIDIGVNARFEMVLVGGEIALHGLTGGAGDATYLQGIGKLGLAVTDSVVAYAAAGAGVDLGPPSESDLLLGGGLTFAVADNVSVDAQYLHGFPLTGANPKNQVTVGANFHF